MGKMVRVNCTSCHKEWKCRTGCGLSHALLQDVIREFTYETGREIMKTAGGEAFPVFLFAYQVAVCSGCHSVVSVPVLELPQQGKVYTGSCPVCGGRAQPVQEIEETSCPACGEKTLQEEETGGWD